MPGEWHTLCTYDKDNDTTFYIKSYLMNNVCGFGAKYKLSDNSSAATELEYQGEGAGMFGRQWPPLYLKHSWDYTFASGMTYSSSLIVGKTWRASDRWRVPLNDTTSVTCEGACDIYNFLADPKNHNMKLGFSIDLNM